VGSTRYTLDSEGCVDVTAEHAALLLQGAMWAPRGRWGNVAEKAKAPDPLPGVNGRRPRTPEELRAAADILGVPMPARKAPDPPVVDLTKIVKRTPVIRRRQELTQ
jgi:hypothetical protein